MCFQAKLTLQGPDLIDYALSNTPPEELNKTEQLWREIYQPTPSEIVHNPALCLLKNSNLKTTIQMDDQNHFFEAVEIDGQTYNVDKDLIKWTTPGRGRQKHPTYATKVIACDNDLEHYTRATFRHCARPSCPSCAHYTITKKTPEQTARIWTKRKELLHTDDWKNQFIHHVAVSVPPELRYLALTPEGKRKLDKLMLEISKKAGIVGGLYVFHPFRYGDDDDIPPEGWAPEDGQRFATFEPHYHIVGFGFIDNRKGKTSVTEQIEASTGWVVKSIRSSSKTDENPIKGPEDVTAILYYIKTHAGIPDEDGAQIGRYKSVIAFGICGPNAQVHVADVEVKQPQICPECGAPMIKHRVHGANGDTSREGQLFASFRYPVYAPRNKADGLRGFLKDNNGDIGGALQYLDSHPFEGTSYLSHTQFAGLVAPLSIKCLDGSLHCVEPYAIMKIRDKKSKNGLVPEIEQNHDPQGFVKLQGLDDQPEASDEDGPEIMPYIDYYLPPEVGYDS